MITFKSFLKPQLPIALLGIGSPEHEQEEQEAVNESTPFVFGVDDFPRHSDVLVKNQLLRQEAQISNPPRNVEEEHHIRQYSRNSADINLPIIAAHVRGLNIENPKHYKEAIRHAYLSGLYGKWGQHQIALPDEGIVGEQYRDALTRNSHPTAIGLQRILKENPTTMPHDMVLFSGVGSRFHVDKIRKEQGDLIHLPAYTSTSISPDTAATFARKFEHDPVLERHVQMKPMKEMVRLHVPGGSKVGRYIEPHSSLRGEMEFVLPRHTILRFHGEPFVSQFDGDEHMIHDATIERQE